MVLCIFDEPVSIIYPCIHIRTCTHTHVHILLPLTLLDGSYGVDYTHGMDLSSFYMYVHGLCICMYMRAHTHTHTHTHTCARTHTHVHIYTPSDIAGWFLWCGLYTQYGFIFFLHVQYVHGLYTCTHTHTHRYTHTHILPLALLDGSYGVDMVWIYLLSTTMAL